MQVMVVDPRTGPLSIPYLVRIGGWTLERYLAEAPESQVWEFVRGEVVVHSPATAEHEVGCLFPGAAPAGRGVPGAGPLGGTGGGRRGGTLG